MKPEKPEPNVLWKNGTFHRHLPGHDNHVPGEDVKLDLVLSAVERNLHIHILAEFEGVAEKVHEQAGSHFDGRAVCGLDMSYIHITAYGCGGPPSAPIHGVTKASRTLRQGPSRRRT